MKYSDWKNTFLSETTNEQRTIEKLVKTNSMVYSNADAVRVTYLYNKLLRTAYSRCVYNANSLFICLVKRECVLIQSTSTTFERQTSSLQIICVCAVFAHQSRRNTNAMRAFFGLMRKPPK